MAISSPEPFGDALDELITGVDDRGKFYPIEKLEAHRASVRHLAISVFLFQGDGLLLQQRAATKYHAPLLWANSACSHPRWQESPDACVVRTLHRELGIEISTRAVARTHYEAQIGALFEHELVDCYRGELPADYALDTAQPQEVAGLRIAGLDEIESGVKTNPERYAPWFRIYVETGLVAALFEA